MTAIFKDVIMQVKLQFLLQYIQLINLHFHTNMQHIHSGNDISQLHFYININFNSVVYVCMLWLCKMYSHSISHIHNGWSFGWSYCFIQLFYISRTTMTITTSQNNGKKTQQYSRKRKLK